MTTAMLEAAFKAPRHPALRWTPIIDGPRRQHRRGDHGDTACGLAGPLTLAESTDARCPDCFPPRAAAHADR